MIFKLSRYSLTFLVFALSITSSATSTRRVITWQNLEEFLNGGWWPYDVCCPGKAFSKPSDIRSLYSPLDANVTGNGVWSGTETASDFLFKRNFTGFEASAKVIEANVTIVYFYRGQPTPYLFFQPCPNGVECYINDIIGIRWYKRKFRMDVTQAKKRGYIDLNGFAGYKDDNATLLLNEVSYSYDTDEPEPTTATTTTTTTDPTTTPTTTTTEPTKPTTTTDPTTEGTTTTKPSLQTTIEPWQNVTEIDAQRDIPSNGRWSFDCATGYADEPSSFSCQAGSVNIPLESLSGEEGFWTKCGLRCLIEYAVQTNDRLYKARIFQKNIMTEVIYDSQSSEFIPGSGWVNLSTPLNGVKSIGIRLDHMDPDVFTLLDKITVEAEIE